MSPLSSHTSTPRHDVHVDGPTSLWGWAGP